MTRRVVILRDQSAPLHYLRCAEPCQPGGWCMHGPERVAVPAHCYLGGYGSPEAAREAAARHGYEVAP